ncbi:MAG TPA: SRPBCC family protein [Dermatophilaceae bacterium]|nr:SRPBCC family protein [Dermatophilaceae bacterium]
MADLRETIHIDAPASLVYDLIADLTRMGEWSPECERVSWRGSATKATKGAQFVGFNRRGTLRWITFGKITAAEQGRHLAFDVFFGPMAISHWEYFVVPDTNGEGCTVAEEWTDRRSSSSRAMSERILGNRTTHNRTGIRLTLAALKRSAEGEHHRAGPTPAS